MIKKKQAAMEGVGTHLLLPRAATELCQFTLLQTAEYFTNDS